ncbi:MAG: hypothetical protein AAFY57_13215 [Cyanobacteria bacterium J06642_2]
MAVLLLSAPARVEANPSHVAINGQLLSQEELWALQMQLGTAIAPGHYLVDERGCWMNITSGQTGCIGSQTTHHFSRYGSGERTGDGSWNHYSNYSGMGVGGTSDGCIYTTVGWSNC